MLEIKDLHVSVGGKEILKGLSLSIGAGQVHAIMGPNGAGKSTLGYVLTGRDGYEVTGGDVRLNGDDLLARCMQHEIDHLDGMLFIFRMSALKRDLNLRKIRKMQRDGKW